MPIGPAAINRANYQCFQTRKALDAVYLSIADHQKDLFNRLNTDLGHSLSELDALRPQFVDRGMIKLAEARIAEAVEFIKTVRRAT